MTWLDFYFETVPEAAVGELRNAKRSREGIEEAPALCGWHMLAAQTALVLFLAQSSFTWGKNQRA